MTTQPIAHTPKLRDRTVGAIADERLGRALVNATDTFDERRDLAFVAMADPSATKELARSIRADVLSRLPELLEQFADKVLAAGGHVCWARTADEARAYVQAVAARRGATKVVKGKSMLSEEIELNAALEGDGIEVTETDLGEWIIQVANETPSHIIVPAIHRDRGQIRDALQRVATGDPPTRPATLGSPSASLSDVPEALAAFAREQLRAKFLEADIGITGVNFGVASTGSMVLVTNEGNGRLTSSVPPVHIALMGMERVVADWEQLDVLLALLPRSATGQAVTTYVSTITGPRRDGERDGPEEFHVVIVDNGRSHVAGSEFAEMLNCIRCGACLNVCPVYRQVGGHAYGWVYSGPMGAVLTPLFAHEEHETANELANASSLCGACWEACPVGIPLQDLLLAQRRKNAHDARPSEQSAWSAWAQTWSRTGTYWASLRAGSAAHRLLGPRLARLPGAKNWATGRTLPTPAKVSFRDAWRRGDR
ncbi:MAG: LutB/LldF family L-lactate oxidation iron-sulfur protein [Acidimicrobiales bacterium]|nr:LutB/LldF family L-lactate oxidation iron-sulfur protein [Acidimicrobiales bacterium]